MSLVGAHTYATSYRSKRSSETSPNHMSQARCPKVVLPMDRKRAGSKANTLFSNDLQEYGTAEAGRTTGTQNSKTLLEAGIVCPKALKDMFCELVNHALVFSGLQMDHLIMDLLQGDVCRVSRLGRWLKYPT
ncbi:hypothetical protein O0I10_010808 [Lichtheimia ornata]|uniref:Uncharacterized protein n=1 Tax=Lichtheimia ornata TaxID=688661 RepID=A0AAD7UU19_9FUNG|nr:uncharacterized protein O0I10_010808 [Lichtheimia ornata]KAJ8653568.1 hypothetical protein O0I10_010808 [Lichtheimia ornata]